MALRSIYQSFVLALISLCSSALAQKILFSFGDSYTDTGFNIASTPPSTANPLGNPAMGTYSFCGGYTYITNLVTQHNTSSVFSYNLAQGGATISPTVVPSKVGFTFQQQVESTFLPTFGQTERWWTPDDAIFSIFFGINDVLNSYQSADPATTIHALVNAYLQYVTELYNSGARHFLFIGVPPFDRSPPVLANGPADAAKCSDWINAFNGQLYAGLMEWSAAHPDVFQQIYDLHAFLTEILDEPTAYGFADATCIDSGYSKCFWYNGHGGPLHMTATVHELIADDMVSQGKISL